MGDLGGVEIAPIEQPEQGVDLGEGVQAATLGEEG